MIGLDGFSSSSSSGFDLAASGNLCPHYFLPGGSPARRLIDFGHAIAGFSLVRFGFKLCLSGLCPTVSARSTAAHLFTLPHGRFFFKFGLDETMCTFSAKFAFDKATTNGQTDIIKNTKCGGLINVTVEASLFSTFFSPPR